ncbi:MAG: helix-turn-helix transcriptional regulator [Lysobacter sp.]
MSESFMRIKQVCERAGYVGKSSLYTAIRAGKFPKPHKRGRTSVWLASEVQAAIDAEAAEMKAAQEMAAAGAIARDRARRRAA